MGFQLNIFCTTRQMFNYEQRAFVSPQQNVFCCRHWNCCEASISISAVFIFRRGSQDVDLARRHYSDRPTGCCWYIMDTMCHAVILLRKSALELPSLKCCRSCLNWMLTWECKSKAFSWIGKGFKKSSMLFYNYRKFVSLLLTFAWILPCMW